MTKFQEGTRVSKRFSQPFHMAYTSLGGKPPPATTGATAEDDKAASAGINEDGPPAEKVAASATKDRVHLDALAIFRSQCEGSVKQQLESRVVLLVKRRD